VRAPGPSGRLFGALAGLPGPASHAGTPALYRVVRHPLLLGFIVAFWATPVMTWGHLLFAGMTTAYMLVGISLEEGDLRNAFGDAYDQYRQQVSMIVPWIRARRKL
jgi:protein-S-isoprenylcysteine O-methyltransferase Ste14